VLPQLKDKKTAVRIVRETEAQVSVYLVVTTLINVGVGVATGVALWLLDMPNAVLWGVIAAVLNFVPYIGGLVNTVILALAALLSFDDVGRALMIPLVFTHTSDGSNVALKFVPAGVVTLRIFACGIRSHSSVLRRSTCR